MEIVACIVEETVSAVLKAMDRAAPSADMFELRLDHIENLDRSGLETLLSNPLRPCIVTNRLRSEGGLFHGSEADRLGLLKQALDFNPAMIDLELAAGEEAVREFTAIKGRSRLIVSFHDFDGTPELSALARILEKMKSLQADLAKIVTRVETPEETLRLKDLLAKAQAMDQPLAAFGLGPSGRLTRVLTPLWGSQLSYCSIAKGREAAPGQMTSTEMRRIYPDASVLSGLTGQTRLFGILGSPVGHSLSPVMHNAAFKHLGLDCFYLPLDVEDARLGLDTVRALNFQGLSVTSPHKIAVMPLLDEIENEDRILGAVNTIINRHGKYSGANTDWRGVVKALEERLPVAGKKAVVAGAGGAARAAVFGLTRAGAGVYITNRTEKKGRKLADELGAEFSPARELKSVGADILINATPLGMGALSGETPFPADLLRPETTVMDMIYHPPRTRLLREAEASGCPVVPGLSMLLHQAYLQFEAWTGRQAPAEIMKKAAEQAMKDNER